MPCVCLCYVFMDLNCNIFAVRGVARQKEVNNGHMIRDPLVIVMNDGLMTRVMNTGHMIGVKGKGHMTEVRLHDGCNEQQSHDKGEEHRLHHRRPQEQKSNERSSLGVYFIVVVG